MLAGPEPVPAVSQTEARAVLRAVVASLPVSPVGVHGIAHWARVMENGRRIAARSGVPGRVVELFALLHDSRRHDDGIDWSHGERAACFVAELATENLLHLPPEDLSLLQEACRLHSRGGTAADPVVQACWDADRLDLGRVHILPARNLLCTEAAKESKLFDWASLRGSRKVVPELIHNEWGIVLEGETAHYPW